MKILFAEIIHFVKKQRKKTIDCIKLKLQTAGGGFAGF